MGILDDLLNESIANIADLPTYDVPPKGFYKFEITKAEMKTVDTKNRKDVPVLDIGYKVLQVMELSDPNEAALVTPNQEFNESYFFLDQPEKTIQAVVTTFREVMLGIGAGNIKELILMLRGLEVYAALNHRVDKNDREKVYAQVRSAKLTTA